MTKKLVICSLLVMLLAFGWIFAACAPSRYEWENLPLSDDVDPMYRDYYHIFVYSFADGDGDGIGDFKGIESKLDYIADLGYNGIYLSPVSPSPTYHKYDVTDYKAVDKAFGTMDDFDSLVTAAHAKGIGVMLDVVFNHSSNQHPWFRAAQTAYREGDTENEYYDYYTFNGSADTYLTFGGYTHMPKLNLDSDGVRAELDDICKFWLQDRKVDAFRLDAAYHYYGNAAKNIEFMQWLMATARQYNENVYMVGEVMQNESTIYAHYAEDSVQSFMDFELSNQGVNPLYQALNSGTASLYTKLVQSAETGTANGINALFASNHDTSRISNVGLSYYSDRAGAVTEETMMRHKMGIGMLYTMAGNVFNYYGNEIGLRNGIRNYLGKDYVDQTYRVAMNWGNSNVESHENGFAYKAYGLQTLFGEYDDKLGGVDAQLDDQNSLYNYNRRVMLLRRQNPEIARGTSVFLDSPDANVALILRTYNGSSVLLAYNLDDENAHELDISAFAAKNGLKGDLVGFLTSRFSDQVTLGGKLKLPAYSIAVIK
ncbi:MAG: alpha-amylase family glycosyl hydrolase [Corallococcus sp.]|nr:alpha-amylase family glycosyl hydrolase [Corallococcus sp.]MCM1360087.1 alpha-amylase family glycosyl hydrolase [Corallococcus sp.]MCM1395644.1 alpha-amylase family glycosyl hydrolase [Corallococcus sp.]